ncbi:MAG: flagellar hook protein FlgE [Betaproteobacteria bacterium]|nr:flagellar hook protein FlgE [Betaproteobacteria bacterium]
MGFQQALSGLDASTSQLDAIGNNIANANTVGFKASTTQFADVFAASLNGSGTNQTGIGTKVSAITQNFAQGNVTASNNSLDMAINGEGFFRMSQNGSISFSRDGQFQLDKNGYLTNAQGLQVTGYQADVNGNIVAATPVPLNIPTANLSPSATANATVGLNLDATSTTPTGTTFNPLDPTTFNNSTSLTIYDSLGNSHIATLYFSKDSTVNTAIPSTANATASWSTYLTVDGNTVPAVTPPTAPTPIGSLGFTSSGALVYPTAASPLKTGQIQVTVPLSNGATSSQKITLDFSSTSQYGAPFGVNQLSQDGFTSGQLSGFSTSPDGVIQGRYSNGQSKNLGQIVLANFTAPQGLEPLGNGQWAETTASGSALVGAPSTGNLGVIQAGAVESSNVDLTTELVDMITAQRDYQANAQAIKTEDQIQQTLVNLR